MSSATLEKRQGLYGGGGLKLVATLTSDGSGDADTAIFVTGWIVRLVTNPDGTATPSANWDLTVIDEDGADVLEGEGLNRDSGGTGASEICGLPKNNPVWIDGEITITGANMGATKTAVVRIYIKPGT